MSTFLTDLWGSIFTPGATPTLLIATNAAFAALQLLLLALLVATYSVHFFILSGLCAGLWWSINWFARELAEAQAKEQEAERIRGARTPRKGAARDAGGLGNEGVQGAGDGTVESAIGRSRRDEHGLVPSRDEREEFVASVQHDLRTAAGSGTRGTGLVGLDDGQARRRRALVDDRSGEASTDSEWEKVEQER